MQQALAVAEPAPWLVPEGAPLVAGCFVTVARGDQGSGASGEPAWAAASLMRARRRVGEAVGTGRTSGPYEPGLLALRLGGLLESAIRALPDRPDVVLVDATGRDHPRRAGLALQLGAVLDVPTIGVTHRPLVAAGTPPADRYGATSPLLLDGAVVGFWVRTIPAAWTRMSSRWWSGWPGRTPGGAICASSVSAPSSALPCRRPRSATSCGGTGSVPRPGAADPPGRSSCECRRAGSWPATCSPWRRSA